MIPVVALFTATFNRPDIARLWRNAVRATLETPHTVTMFHANEAPGTDAQEIPWDIVGLARDLPPQMGMVFNVMPKRGARLFLEEDMIPVRPWHAGAYLGNPSVLQGPGNTPWWGLAGYIDGPPRPLMYSKFNMIAQYRVTERGCPDWLPPELCELALAADSKIVGDHFLHIDKISTRHGPNKAKDALVAALETWVADKPVASLSIPSAYDTTKIQLPPDPRSKVRVRPPRRPRKNTSPKIPPPPKDGPGTELKRLLGRLGIHATPNCACNARAIIMDHNGCDWCEQNIDTISGWLREEATKRKLPYLDIAGKTVIRLAIRRARKKQQNAEPTPSAAVSQTGPG